MANNNTECLIEKLVIAGPSKKKNLLSNNELVQQYFKDKMELLTAPNLDFIYNSISIFDSEKDKYETKIIEEIQDLIQLNPDKLLFGMDEIQEAYNNFELKEIIMDEQKMNELNLKDNKVTKIIKISSNKLNVIGIDMIGVKWHA
jgi:hypothetical protein